MKIGEAVAALGIVQADGDIAIVRPSDKGMVHYTLAEVENVELRSDTYLATGTFGPGTITRKGGRSAGNLIRINELPFDFDLSDFTGIPKADLWAMPDESLWTLIEAQREAVEFAFRSIGLTLHRIDYTGYGLAGYLKLPLHKPDAIPAIQALHVRIVERINAIARVKLCDPQVKDAGTRIMRLPGCLNTKGEIHRLSRTLTRTDGLVTEAQLQVAAGATSSAPARIVPVAGSLLDEATTDQLIAAVQPHWTLGQKHHLALAISGLLAKAGVPEEQTLSIISRLSAFDDKPWDREKCVNRSYERVRSGDAVKGFYGLRETLPPELLDWLDGIAQRVRQANAPILTAGGQRFTVGEGRADESPNDQQPNVQTNNLPEFFEPPDCVFSGWVGDYVSLMEPTTEAPRAFHLGIGLTTAGALVGRHVHTVYGSDPLYPNLYTLIVGQSGRTRKDTAIRRSITMLRQNLTVGTSTINHGVNIATDVGSSVALINELKDAPNTLLYLTEFSRIMGNARRKGSETILPTLMEAFDTPFIIQNKSMGNPISAEFPFLSILSATQPEILSGLMTSDDLHSGFANRWLFVCGNPASEGIADPPVLDRAVATSLFHDFWLARCKYEMGKGITLAKDAADWWRSWYLKDFRHVSESPEEDAMRARHAVLIRKIALIYAIGDGATNIRVQDLERGTAFVEWSWAHVQRMLGTWGRSIEGQIESRIVAALERKGAMKRRELQISTSSRKWSGSDFTKAFDNMVKNQWIAVDPLGVVALNRTT